ncbi:MAG: hypothetical protein HKO65_08435 [Gemmatimonadetes bacterium]|nr:hypothetical protein [Gemmatimonadota bacterium]
MDDGGLFFWLIIFAVAVLQGIGQRKKKSGQKPGPLAGQGGPGSPRPRPAQRRPESPSEASTLATAQKPRQGGTDKSSEGMIPSEVWEEILGLAQGKPPKPKPSPPVLRDEDPGPARSEEPQPPRERPSSERERAPMVARRETRPAPREREFPKSHGAGAALHETEPSDVASRLPVAAGPEERAGGEKAASPRSRLFGDGSPEELRKAIILKEVLGSPLALREER